MSNEYKDWWADFSEKQKKIYHIILDYPFLYPRDVRGNFIEDYDYNYLPLSIPDGWDFLFLQLCNDIKPLLKKAGLLDEFYFTQVKEKYNTLRCYHHFKVPQEVNDLIQKYEIMSQYICCKCGAPAHSETTGYYLSYCKNCMKNIKATMEKLKFKKSFYITRHEKGKSTRRRISFRKEWHNYKKEFRNVRKNSCGNV